MENQFKKISFIIPNEVFRSDALFIFNHTREEISYLLAEKGFENYNDFDEGDDPKFDFCTVNARAYLHPFGAIIVRFKDWEPNIEGLGFLCHEVFHVTEFLMHRLGVKHDVWSTSEVFAYHQQYYFQKSLEGVEFNSSIPPNHWTSNN